jgi:hypothetical protein
VIVRSYIDVSYLKLFAAPGISLVAGMGLVVLFKTLYYSPTSDFWNAIGGSLFFCGGYLTMLLILEGKQIYLAIHEIASRSDGLRKVDDFLRLFKKS